MHLSFQMVDLFSYHYNLLLEEIRFKDKFPNPFFSVRLGILVVKVDVLLCCNTLSYLDQITFISYDIDWY